MRREERHRLIGILNDGFENGGPVQGEGIVRSPLADYTSTELLAEERQVFFRQTPLFMGLSADLPENGSYWADSEAGLPILMTRDETGCFRAFANTCRHRGAQVVPEVKAYFEDPEHPERQPRGSFRRLQRHHRRRRLQDGRVHPEVR